MILLCQEKTAGRWGLGAMLVLAMCGLAPPAAAAVDAYPSSLDALLLVDVSESMRRRTPESPPGDKGGVRWDGVNLILDIATAEDRVGVITFGGEITPFLDAAGHLLRPMTQAGRQELQRRLREMGADSSDTPLLDTLDAAAQRLRAERDSRSPRSSLVMLLTDGHETRRPKEAAAEESLYSHLQYFRDSGVPIHVIGLGGAVDETMLTRVAHYTHGSYRHVSSNAQLLETMRDIHWAAKRLWIKRQKVQPDGSGQGIARAGSLHGVADLGILIYRESGTPPRLAQAPSQEPSLQWFDAGGRPIAAAITPQVRRHPTYTFYYFGAERGVSPLARLSPDASPVVVLDSPDPHVVVFSKRTASVLFDLESPGGQAKFRYGEPIPVRVRFYSHAIHLPEQFEVKALVVRPDDDKPCRELSLAWHPEIKSFSDQWSVSPETPDLAEGFYEVAVIVQGKQGPMDGYRLELPRRTIYLGGRFNLSADPREIVLDRENNYQQEVVIQADTDAAFPVECGISPPRLDGKPIGSAKLFWIWPTKPKCEGGALRLEVGLVREGAAAELPRGRPMDRGYVELRGPYLAQPRRIPLGLSLGLVKVALSPETVPPLVADPQQRKAVSSPLTLKAVGEPLPPGLKCSVSLAPPEGLKPGEIGLFLSDPAEMKDTLEVAAGQAFHAAFTPAADRLQGLFHGRMQVQGKGIESCEWPLVYELNPPVLELTGTPLKAVAVPGENVTLSLGIGLTGAGKHKIFLVAKEGTGPRAIFHGPDNRRLPLEFRGPTEAEPLELEAGASRRATLRIAVPERAECGVYTAEILAGGRGIPPVPFRVELAINDLTMEQTVWRDGRQTAVPAEEVTLFAVTGSQVSLPLKIRDKLGRGVDVARLEMLASDPLSDHRHTLAAPAVQPKSADGSVLLTFAIPKQVFTSDEYQLDFRVNDRDNPMLRAETRIRLVIAERPLEIEPHNPVVFEFTDPHGEASQSREYLAQTKSPHYLQWEIEPGPLPRAGGDKNDQIPAENVQVRYVKNEPIRAGSPGKVLFTVTPGTVRPGHYVGACRLKTSTLAPPNQFPDQKIRLEVLVAGRDVGPPALETPAAKEKIYVKRPLFLAIDVECVGCELGRGTATVLGPPAVKDSPASRESQEIEINRGQITGSEVRTEDKTVRYHLLVPVAAARVGQYQLKVAWEPLFSGGERRWAPAERLAQEASFEAFPALAVEPPVAVLFERARVEAITRPGDDHQPDGIHINVIHRDPTGAAASHMLFLVDDGNNEEFGDRVSGDGTYSAPVTLDAPGVYTFELGSDSELQTEMAPATVSVAFDLQGRLGPRSDGSVTPVVLEVTPEMDRTKEQKTTIEDALSIHSSVTSAVRWSASIQWQPEFDARRDPVVFLTKTQGELKPGGSEGFDLVVGLPAVDGPESPPHPAWEPKLRNLTLVVDLSWNDEKGLPFSRTIRVPLDLETIDRSGRWWIVWLLVAGAVVLATAVYLSRFVLRGKKEPEAPGGEWSGDEASAPPLLATDRPGHGPQTFDARNEEGTNRNEA